jgi:hypothetical protein
MASSPSAATRIDLSGAVQTGPMLVPDPPTNPAVGASYLDGLEVAWDAATVDGGSPIVGYRVTATDIVLGSTVECQSYWDETSCVLRTADGLTDASSYVIDVRTVTVFGESTPVQIDGDELDSLPPEPDPYLYVVGIDPAPVRSGNAASVRVPDPIVDFELTTSSKVDIRISGYVSIPQGHLRINASNPTDKHVDLLGGLAAGQIRLEAAPSSHDIVFDNPIAQKRIRLQSTATSGGYTARSDAVVKVNRSGSIAINSWFVQ